MAKTTTKTKAKAPVEELSVQELAALSPGERFLRLSGPRKEARSQPTLFVPDLAYQWALQRPGYAGGRVITLAADPGASKSSAALTLCNLARRQNGVAKYYDLEHALNKDHVSYYLDDPKDFDRYIEYPETIEEAVEDVRKSLVHFQTLDPNREIIKVIVLDSLAGAPSERELSDEVELSNIKVGNNTPFLTVVGRVLPALASRAGAIVVLVNHAKEKIFTGMEALVPRSQEDKLSIPGGKGLLYGTSYLEYIKKGGQLTDTDKVRTGFKVTSKFLRNRGRHNGRTYSYDVVFGEGFRYYPHTMDFLAGGGTCGLKVKARRYWCPDVGVTEQSKLNDEEMYQLIHGNVENLAMFQAALEISNAPDYKNEDEDQVEPGGEDEA